MRTQWSHPQCLDNSISITRSHSRAPPRATPTAPVGRGSHNNPPETPVPNTNEILDPETADKTTSAKIGRRNPAVTESPYDHVLSRHSRHSRLLRRWRRPVP